MRKMIKFLVITMVALAALFIQTALAASSGMCGDNVRYTLSDDGVLTISGTGPMYGNPNGSPFSTSIKSVIIQNGVTSIGECAFEGCSGLTSVVIPDSVTSIGSSAFSFCRGLTSIEIPNSVTSIGYSAFWGCTGLTSINIPNSVTSIGSSAFNRCTGLTSIEISNSVTSIGYYTFWGCTGLTSIEIPNSVTSIGESAFYGCTGLTSIEIPNSVTSIGYTAFWGCTGLTSINIPNSVTSIGESAFGGCAGLTSIEIPDSVTRIDSFAFPESRLSFLDIGERCYIVGGGDDCKGTYIHVNRAVLKRILAENAEAFDFGNTAVYVSDSEVTILYYGRLVEFGEDIDMCYVPSRISGLPVTSIAENAYKQLSGNACLYIPDTIEYIHPNAIPKGVTVYCHEYSEADFWGEETGHNRVYVDDTVAGDHYRLCIGGPFKLECGNSKAIETMVWPITGEEEINCSWSSSNPECVAVENGIVTALKPGTSTITLTVAGSSKSILVTAFAQPKSFELSQETVYVLSKESVQLYIENIQPEGVDFEATWASLDESIATVDRSGLVTAKRPGVTTITATSQNGIIRESQVNVCYPVSSISFEQETYTLYLGESETIKAFVTTRDDVYENKLVAFETSDETVATIDNNGTVFGVSTGVVTITAIAANGVSATTTVTVTCPDHHWEIDPAVEATCTEAGLTEGKSCPTCHEALIPQQEIPALGHDWQLIAEAPADIGIEGSRSWICDRCGERMTESIPARVEGYWMTGKVWKPYFVMKSGTEAYLPEDWPTIYDSYLIFSEDGVTGKVMNKNGYLVSLDSAWDMDDEYQICIPGMNTLYSLVSTARNASYIVDLKTLSVAMYTNIGRVRVTFNCQEDGSEDASDSYIGTWKADHIYRGSQGSRIPCTYLPSFADMTIVIRNDDEKTVSINGTEGKWAYSNGVFFVDGKDSGLALNSFGQLTFALGDGDFLIMTKDGQSALLALRTLELPAALKSIGSEAFAATDAQMVIIPERCVSIGSRAFANSRALELAILPASVSSIAEDAFEGCTLTLIAPADSYAASWAKAHGIDVINP